MQSRIPAVARHVDAAAKGEAIVDHDDLLMVRRARRVSAEHLGYATPLGAPALRGAIARYAAAARGVQCTPEQVLIVSGTQQALRLAAEVLLNPGDTAWVEDPGYQGALGALAAVGATIVGVPVDEEGIDVEAGRARAPSARLAYVSPSHQFPRGGRASSASSAAWPTRCS